MITSAHTVALSGVPVGTMYQRGDASRFVFQGGYWDDPKRPVLGLWFEDDPRRSPKAALRVAPWFSNLLPEGALRKFIAKDQGVASERELQLLLRIGLDLPGAVQVVPGVTASEFDEALLSEVMPVRSSTAPSQSWKFSLAGVGLKFSLLQAGDRLTIPADTATGDWIVKLPDPDYPQVPENEFATMALAASVGIDVPETVLIHRDELPPLPPAAWQSTETLAYGVKRFDRGDSGTRIHIEDFAQVRGWYPEAKYDGSFESLAALAYRGRDICSLHEFVRRLTFSLLVGNGDAHLKNWSLIYPDTRRPRLSPAYDLVSTGAYYSSDSPDDLGLKFGGTRDFSRVRRDSFERMSVRLGVDTLGILSIVDLTIQRFRSAWQEGASQLFPEFVSDWITPHSERVASQLSS